MPEAYAESCHTFKMEAFTKTVNCFPPLIIYAKVLSSMFGINTTHVFKKIPHIVTKTHWWILYNRNTLTGPANCNKTTKHHAHLSLCAKSRESQAHDQKPQFGQFFDDFEVKYLQIAIFFEKQVSFKLKVIFSTNFRPKTKKIFRAVFEKNIKVSDFWLIWRPFREYLQIKNFSQKSGCVTFLPL